MTANGNLEALILSQCSERPQKVAMIIAKVAEVGTGIEPEAIGDRIVALVDGGELSAVGDVTDWRYSEIALLPDH